MEKEYSYFIATVISNGLRYSKEKHTPSVAIQCQLITDISKKPCTEFRAGATMYGDLYLTPNAIGKTFDTLQKILGWKGSDIAELNEPVLAGKKVKLACSIDEKTGQLKINYFNSTGVFKPLEKNELDELCEKTNQMIKEIKEEKIIKEETLPF